MTGKLPYLRATCSSDCAFSRCCQSGVRSPGRRRGISSERAGVLAEARAEERRLADLGDDEVLDLARVDHQLVDRRRDVGLGEVQRDPVVRPDRLRLDAERVAQPRGDRHRPRRVHAAAERREDADAPVADLVAEALDDDRAVGRDGAGGVVLLAQEGEQVGGGAPVEVVLVGEPRERLVVLQRRLSSRDAAPIFWPSSNGRPTPSPFQNGTAPGTPGAGETSTRSRVISSIRQVEAPSRKV